jgi:hypothetical protein
MAIVAQVILRGVSREQYDALRSTVGWIDTTPTGGLAHIAWWVGEDNYNLDAWESEDAFNAFGAERLGPAMAELGIAVEPEVTFHAAHEVFLPQPVVLT